jgi:hypothetical protein
MEGTYKRVRPTEGEMSDATGAPEFRQIGSFFRQARMYFQRRHSATAGGESPTLDDWVLRQKQRLMNRLAAHWTFLTRCYLYNVHPTHLTDGQMRLTFSCVLPTDGLDDASVAQAKEALGNFIRKCGLSFEESASGGEGSVLTYNIIMGS